MIDIEERALLRLATAPMPSAYSVDAGNRRDVVAEDEARILAASTTVAYLHELRVHLAWVARRLRRELGL